MSDSAKLKLVHTAIKKKFQDKKLIFGQGPLDAKIAVVSEMVGPAEEKEKAPIAGDAAKELNKLLKTLGLDRRKVYITNVVKYRPAPGVNIHPKEIKSHSAFLKEELRTVNPQIVVTLGNLALNGVGMRQPVENIHGRSFNLGSYELLPTFHPQAVAKNQALKPLVDSDFVKLKQLLELKKNQPQEL